MSAAFFARFHVWRVEPVRQNFETCGNLRQEMARPPQRSRPLRNLICQISNTWLQMKEVNKFSIKTVASHLYSQVAF